MRRPSHDRSGRTTRFLPPVGWARYTVGTVPDWLRVRRRWRNVSLGIVALMSWAGTTCIRSASGVAQRLELGQEPAMIHEYPPAAFRASATSVADNERAPLRRLLPATPRPPPRLPLRLADRQAARERRKGCPRRYTGL